MCDSCLYLKKYFIEKTRKNIRDSDLGLEHALEMVVKSEIIPTYAKLFSDFSKTINHFFSDKFYNLCRKKVESGLLSRI